MAKMFYTMDEVCEKLGKTQEEVTQMVSSGQIQEFRDRDRLMFKAEQIDLLAGDEDTGEVKLDLESGSGLSGSGLSLEDESSIGLGDSREGTGISVFDTDHGLDESEQTQTGDVDEELTLDAVGSGSGLLDLTRESDDTSLGAALLEEVYQGDDENIEMPANASGLFDAAPEAPQSGGGGAAVAMPVLVESYDGAGSGLGIGLMIGALAALVCVAILVIVGVMGGTAGLTTTFASNLYVWAGGLLGVTIVLGLIGMFFGKASE